MGWFFNRKTDKPKPHNLNNFGVIYLGDSLDAGIVVDRETAMEITTVFACINRLSVDIGQVPIDVYFRGPNGREKAEWTREQKMFRHGPNGYQTTQDWLEQAVQQILIHGDHYARIGRLGGDKYVGQLFPYDDPTEWTVELVAGQKVFKRANQTYTSRDIFHVHGPSIDGFRGRDMVDNHRQTLSLAKALYRYGASFFANGGAMGGILILPPGATEADAKAAKAKFLENYGGGKVHSIAAYTHGTDFKPISIDPEKSQALGLRKEVSKDFASLFRMPLWRLYGEVAPSETAHSDYTQDTLGPWFVRFAGNFNKQILNNSDEYYAEFNTAALLRADAKKRFETYEIGIRNRILSPNEARARENLNGYDGGDEFVNPNTTAFDARGGNDNATKE